MAEVNRTAKPARRLVRYTRAARGPWSAIALQGHHAVVAALDRIAPEVAAAPDAAEIHDIVSALAALPDLDRLADATVRGGPVHPSSAATGTISRGSDGSVLMTRTETLEGGTAVTTCVTYQGGTVTRTHWHVANPDGTGSWGSTVNESDGSRTEYRAETDAQGNVTSERDMRYDADGNPASDGGIAVHPAVDRRDSDLAQYFRAWHRAVHGPAVAEFTVPVRSGRPPAA